MDHKSETVKSFNKQFGPFSPDLLELVGEAYDYMYQMVGGIMTANTPKKAAHGLACGMLAQMLKQRAARKGGN